MSLNIFLLKLENNKFYVNLSYDIIINHWLIKYKVINVIKIIHNCYNYHLDIYTIMYMNEYGINNVRGGRFIDIELCDIDLLLINKFINNNSNLHYICDQNYNKINGINHILWVNLDRSHDRKIYMENIFSKINIPNTRISAIDGKNYNLTESTNLFHKMNNCEIATTLSHIKAISFLQKLDGNYFCICEDDIALDNIKYFTNDLNDIILKAPNFDILLITKIYNTKLEELYTKWISGIYSTACYIISKKGIDNFINHSSYNKDNNNFNIMHPISVADHYIYNYVNTYVYKYNFINTLDATSLIHPEYLSVFKSSSFFQLYNIINDNLL
jgi:GR25 family glycosyltransferase involved in LPS biosynthesis